MYIYMYMYIYVYVYIYICIYIYIYNSVAVIRISYCCYIPETNFAVTVTTPYSFQSVPLPTTVEKRQTVENQDDEIELAPFAGY